MNALSWSLIAPGQQAHGRIDDREGGGLAAAEHEVAERELLGGEVLGDALVHVLVVPAEDGELVAGGEAHGVGLREAPTARAHQHDGRRGAAATSTASKNGSGFITIPGPPPYGASSTRAMPVVGVVAQVRRGGTSRSPPPPRAPGC